MPARRAARTAAMALETPRRMHFMRNLLAHVPHKDKKQVAAWVCTIFAQPDLESAQAQLTKVKSEEET